jgi:hypothetical protein
VRDNPIWPTSPRVTWLPVGPASAIRADGLCYRRPAPRGKAPFVKPGRSDGRARDVLVLFGTSEGIRLPVEVWDYLGCPFRRI